MEQQELPLRGGQFDPAPTTKSCPAPMSILGLLLASKRASGRREVYIQSLDHYLSRFLKGRDCLQSVSTADIESFLGNLNGNGNTRATWLNRINTLFSYAVRQEFIQKNPCDKIERHRIDRKAPAILTAAQSKTVLALAPTDCLPCVVLCMYAGIRPEECHSLDWSDINLEAKTVMVSRTKTRIPRIVPLEPVAAVLLAAHPVKLGPVAPSHATVRRFKRRARHALGWWSADVLRHTAASFLLAKYKDAGKVSTMLGNSSAVLLKHYHTPVADDEAERFWSVGGGGGG